MTIQARLIPHVDAPTCDEAFCRVPAEVELNVAVGVFMNLCKEHSKPVIAGLQKIAHDHGQTFAIAL